MTLETSVGGSVAVGALITLLIRALPILLLSRIHLPSPAQDWLRFIPSAIMAALIAADLVANPEFSEGGISISLAAALVTMAGGLLTRSLFLTVALGVTAFFALRWLLG